MIFLLAVGSAVFFLVVTACFWWVWVDGRRSRHSRLERYADYMNRRTW